MGWEMVGKVIRSAEWDVLSLKCLLDLYLMSTRKLNILLWILREISLAWHSLFPMGVEDIKKVLNYSRAWERSRNIFYFI